MVQGQCEVLTLSPNFPGKQVLLDIPDFQDWEHTNRMVVPTRDFHLMLDSDNEGVKEGDQVQRLVTVFCTRMWHQKIY